MDQMTKRETAPSPLPPNSRIKTAIISKVLEQFAQISNMLRTCCGGPESEASVPVELLRSAVLGR